MAYLKIAALILFALLVAGGMWLFKDRQAESLHADIATLKAQYAERERTREVQARRAIETARRTEQEGLQDELKISAALRDRLASNDHDLSAARGRLRQLESAARAYRASLPTTPPLPVEASQPIPSGFLLRSQERTQRMLRLLNLLPPDSPPATTR